MGTVPFKPKPIEEILADANAKRRAPKKRTRWRGKPGEQKPMWAILGEDRPISPPDAEGATMLAQAPQEVGEPTNKEGDLPDQPTLEPFELPGRGAPFNTHVDAAIIPNLNSLLELNDQSNAPTTFHEGFRDTGYQRGLRDNPDAVTPAAPGMSLHEAGRAFDMHWNSLSPEQQQSVLENVEAAGFGWGGNFNTPDPSHIFIEAPGGQDSRREYIQQMQERYRRMMEGQ